MSVICRYHENFDVDKLFSRLRYSIISCRDFRLMYNIPILLIGISVSNSSISMYYLDVPHSGITSEWLFRGSWSASNIKTCITFVLNLIFKDSALLEILSQQKTILLSDEWKIKLNINISQKRPLWAALENRCSEICYLNSSKILIKKFIYSEVEPVNLLRNELLHSCSQGFWLQVSPGNFQSSFLQNTYSGCFSGG